MQGVGEKNLSGEAIRLDRLLVELLPEPESIGRDWEEKRPQFVSGGRGIFFIPGGNGRPE